MVPTSAYRFMAAAAASAFLAAPSLAATYNISNATELASALKQATSGDLILLQPGEYGDVRIFRRRITGERVHITSAYRNNPARLGHINLEGSEGFLFTGLDISGSQTPIIKLTGNAANISFHGNSITGANRNKDPWDDNNTAVHVRSASKIAFTENVFQDLKTAIYVQNSFDVTIARNNFQFLREGINIGSLGRGNIVGNYFHNFYPRYDLGEHPDAIQFWTRGETWGSHDIGLHNNFFALGGPRAVHGIFARSEEAESYNRPVYLHRFTISGNVYYGSALHGISLSSVLEAKVYNNVAVASPWADTNNSTLKFPDGRQSGGLQPQIRIVNTSGSTAWNNVAMGGAPSSDGVTSWSHIKIYDTHRKTGEPWTSVFAERPTADIPPLSAFVTVNPNARALGIGLLETYAVGQPAQTPVLSKLENGTPVLFSNQPTKF